MGQIPQRLYQVVRESLESLSIGYVCMIVQPSNRTNRLYHLPGILPMLDILRLIGSKRMIDIIEVLSKQRIDLVHEETPSPEFSILFCFPLEQLRPNCELG